LTVTDPQISGSGRHSTAEAVYAAADLERMSARDSDGSTLTIFNEQGQTLYSGEWSEDKEAQVMRPGGLYIYRIVRNGIIVRSGKIFKKSI
ncbi:MAG TPA: hypothetical protein VEB86_02615, partial [Chryseosolibacter sp.]|nr:hypothetical protein [Chryseosolibacter sp.]